MPGLLPAKRSVVNLDRVFKHCGAIAVANQHCIFVVLLLNISGVSQTFGSQ